MKIKGINSFNSKYSSLDQSTCSWLKQNFSNSKAQATREGKEIQIIVDELQQGDSLTKIFDFPVGFKRLDAMTDKLFGELKRRGFLAFDAELNEKAATNSTKTLNISNSVKLLEEVSEGAQLRTQLSENLAATFVKVGQGSSDISDMQEMSKSVLQKSSPEALTAIANLRESEQTYAHSIDVGAIFLDIYQKSGMAKNQASFVDSNQILLAGFLHDIGKSKVPKDIIESTKRFELNSPEMHAIRSHPVYGAEILAKMDLPDTVAFMAGQHHIKVNTEMVSSYPNSAVYDQVLPESRLLAVVDVYQALVGKRKYKKSWSPPEAIRFLESLAGIEFDEASFASFISVMGLWPVGSLVELNDSSKAFVVKQGADGNRPILAQIISASGERLTHNSILDLAIEKDMSIVTDHSVDAVFGEEEGMDVFASLQVC